MMVNEAISGPQLSGHSLLSDLPILEDLSQLCHDLEEKSQNSRWLVTVFVAFILIVLLVIFIQKKHSYWKDKRIPYTKPTFLIGNTFQRLGLSIPFYEVR